MKKFVAIALSLIFTLSCVACSSGTTSGADTYPEDTISIIVPFNAGSNTDIQMRFFQPYLEDVLGVSTVIINDGGASGTIGLTNYLNEYESDGYTVVFSLPTPTVYKPITNETTYTSDDLVAVAQLTGAPLYLAVRADSPYTTGADLIEYIAANPDTYSYANAGNGGIAHLAFASFLNGEGLSALSVPFTGGTADCYSAVMGGHVDAYCVSEQDLVGRDDVRPLINLGSKSTTDGFESVPTLEELGYDGYCIDAFSAFYFSADVDAAIVEKFQNVVEEIVNDPAFIEAAEASSFGTNYLSGADTQAMIATTIEKVTPVMDALGLIVS